jgi:universal stress protein E
MSAVRAAKLKALTELASEYGVPPANIYLEMGGVRASICSVAAEVRADVVVMGTVSSNGLTRALIGSTAEEVLERLPCDALIVKS